MSRAKARLLPTRSRLLLDPETVVGEEGTWIAGGQPLVVARLTPRAAALTERLAAGLSVGDLEQPLGNAVARWLSDRGLAHPRPSPADGPSPDQVSAIIPLGEADRQLGATLSALADAGVGEIVVVADGVDPTRALAEAPPGPTLVVVRTAERLGPAAARNRGARAATNGVLAFCDSDCVPLGACLDVLLAHLGDPSVALVAPRVIGHPPAHGPGGRLGWPARLERYEAAFGPHDQGLRAAPVRHASRVPWVPGAFVVVDAKAFWSVGGFDESLRTGEDVDLCWRLEAAGWRLRYEPAALAEHSARTELRAWLRQRFGYGASAGPLARRHRGRSSLGVASPTSIATAAWFLGAPSALVVGTWVLSAASLFRRLERLTGTTGALDLARRQLASAIRASPAQLASALGSAWAPVVLATLAVTATGRTPRPLRRLGRRAAFLVLARHGARWLSVRPDLDLASTVALGLAGDAAFGAGVWRGCIAARSAWPLVPRLAKAPTRRQSSGGGPARDRSSRPALPPRTAGQEA